MTIHYNYVSACYADTRRAVVKNSHQCTSVLDEGPLPNFLDSASSLSTSTLHRQRDRLRVGVESGVMNVEVPQRMGRSWVFPQDEATIKILF